MKTLAILSRKGGAGKSTLAVHLAVQAVAGGLRVALVDMDPQRSAADWWRTREADAPELVEVHPGDLAAVVKAAEDAGVDLVICDTRPSAEADAQEAAESADLALVVVRPSILDLRAVNATVETVQAAGTPGLVVVNQAPPARGIAEAGITREAVGALQGFGVPVATTIIHARAAFASALIDGRAVLELEPAGKAAGEIAALWNELEARLWPDGRN